MNIRKLRTSRILTLGLVIAMGSSMMPSLNGVYAETKESGDKASVNVWEAKRIYGAGRIETSISVADELKRIQGIECFDNIIVASANDYPDALSGSYLAKVKGNAPILLVNASSEDKVAKYIKANLSKGGKVYILGGTAAVSPGFEKKMASLEVDRLWGQTRTETNMRILKNAGIKGGELIVCTDSGYADSLSASAAGEPILLVGKKLTNSQKKYLSGLEISKIYVIGGEAAVSSGVANEVVDAIPTEPELERIGGQSRYETSANVANSFFGNDIDGAVITYGANFPDGLSGGPIATELNSPLLLATNTQSEDAEFFCKKVENEHAVVLGGPALIDDAVRESMINDKTLVMDNEKYDGAIFYSPHEDDETLFFGQVICDTVETFGSENVYVVEVSDGTASNAQNVRAVSQQLDAIIRIADGKYAQSTGRHLTNAERAALRKKLFSKARENEMTAALHELGVSNIISLGYPDGHLSQNEAQVADEARNFANTGNYMHFSFTPYFEPHADHRAVGNALRTVSKEGIDGNKFYCIVKSLPETEREFNKYESKHSEKHKLLEKKQFKGRMQSAISEFYVMSADPKLFGNALAETAIGNGETLIDAVDECEAMDELRLKIGPQSVPRYFNNYNRLVNAGHMTTLLHPDFDRE